MPKPSPINSDQIRDMTCKSEKLETLHATSKILVRQQDLHLHDINEIVFS